MGQRRGNGIDRGGDVTITFWGAMKEGTISENGFMCFRLPTFDDVWGSLPVKIAPRCFLALEVCMTGGGGSQIASEGTSAHS